jgi:glyoxylase-like metal-dependent hydrolase (beta-lactamase superfamily II)
LSELKTSAILRQYFLLKEANLLFSEAGLVVKDLYVAGFPWSACYLLDGKRPVLFESGYTAAGRLYAEAIREALGEREPEILFLTHVHYDHCGATGYLKRAFPSLRVAASERSAGIMRRPNALALITELSRQATSYVSGSFNGDRSKLIDEPFEPFDVDIIVGEGETVDLDGITVQVMATPGHTRDMLSYYVPERKILFTTETAGCQDAAGHILISAPADYDAFLSSFARVAALPIEILCQGHRFVWVGGDEVRDFLARSLFSAKHFREKVERQLREEQGSIERVVARIKSEEYDTNMGPKQPEGAYLVNLRATVSRLAEGLKE